MQKSLVFIFITVLIDVTGLGIIIPVLPDLIKELSGRDISSAAQLSGYMSAAYSILLFLCAPIMGALSDQYGRRPVLLLSLFGFGLDYIFQGFASSIAMLFVGRVIAGITGASYSTAAAYISDVSEPEKKAQNFGLIGAAFGLGFIIGPALGALLGHYGLRVPFFGSAALALLNLLFGIFVLPESLDIKNRRQFDWKRANPFGTFRVLFQYPVLRGFLLILFLSYLAHFSLQSTWSFYTIEKFKWNHDMVGYSLACVGLMTAIVQGLLTRILIPKLGTKNSIYIGMATAMFGYLSYALAPSTLFMFLTIIPFAFSGLAGPAIQGLVANQVPKNAQGELQGGMTSLMGLSAIVGPLMMTNLFRFFTKDSQSNYYFPGAAFMMAFCLVLIAAILTFRLLNKPEEKTA